MHHSIPLPRPPLLITTFLTLAATTIVLFAALHATVPAQGQEPPTGTTPKHFLFEIKGTAPPGDLSQPVALAEAEDGTLYLLDARDHQVRHIQRDGTVLEVWGSFGHADGQFAWPTDIDIGPDGSVYVLDGGNARVQRFDPNGKHLVSWGSEGNQIGQFYIGRIFGSVSGPPHMTIGQNGEVYVLDRGHDRVQVFSQNGVFAREWFILREFPPSEPSEQQQNSLTPHAIATDHEGNILLSWGEETGHRRVPISTYLRKYTPTGQVLQSKSLLLSPAFSNDRVFATDMAVAPDGRIFMSSRGDDIVALDSMEEALHKWPSLNSETVQISPGNLAMSGRGSLFVIDQHVASIQERNLEGQLLAVLETQEAHPAQIDSPVDLLFTSQGDLLVGSRGIQSFNPSGVFSKSWNFKQEGDDRILSAIQIDEDLDGKIYTADSFNRNIKIFSPKGELLDTWTPSEPQVHRHWTPLELAVTPKKRSPDLRQFFHRGPEIQFGWTVPR